MINNTYDQEGDINPKKQPNPNPISRQHSVFKNNPRIVKGSQASGGKDRHSKVWTVKGLRDRRIRLSIPTAIQLYDLQDKLGLSQPSKVIDWLLDVTKDDINKLPPLQMALEDFSRFHLPSPFVPQDFNTTQLSLFPYFNIPTNDHQRTKGKEAILENKTNTNNYHDHFHPSSNLSLSRFGHQLDTYIPSSSALSLQPPFFSCFSSIAPPAFCPPSFMPNHFQFLSSSSPQMLLNSLVPVPLINIIDTRPKLPFGLNMNSKVDTESNDEG